MHVVRAGTLEKLPSCDLIAELCTNAYCIDATRSIHFKADAAKWYERGAGIAALDRSVTARLVELLHLGDNLLESCQPFVEFLLHFGLRLAELWVKNGSVWTCIHGQLG